MSRRWLDPRPFARTARRSSQKRVPGIIAVGIQELQELPSYLASLWLAVDLMFKRSNLSSLESGVHPPTPTQRHLLQREKLAQDIVTYRMGSRYGGSPIFSLSPTAMSYLRVASPSFSLRHTFCIRLFP